MFAQARRRAIKIVGEKRYAFDRARGRLVLISGFFVLAYMLMGARAIDLMAIQGSLGSRGGQEEDFAAAKPAIPVRGDILDRNGALMATTLRMASLYADTRLIPDPAAVARGLVRIFPDISYGETLQKLQSGKRFIWIKRHILPVDQSLVLALGQPGLLFEYEGRRFYPEGSLAAHLVGFTDVDNRGQAGIERSFDNFLSGGSPVTLTIDIRLQHALRREIARSMEKFSARAGAGVIMDVTNGEILAGVSLPDFDPHNPGGADTEALFNRLTLGTYELGSVFKIFTVAALLEKRHAPMDATFDARVPIIRGKFAINDYHAENRLLTVPEVFMYSSNIGAALMGEAVGTEPLKDFYESLGLLDPLNFEIREVARPLVPSPWRDINTLTAAFGHGVATTPLQLVSAVSSIANGGLLVRPRLVLGQEPSGGAGEIRVVSPETSRKMCRLMRLVVTDGTGTQAEVPGYRVGGKTGTAEKIGERGRYEGGKLLSSFIGVFPVGNPRYAVFIMLDEPKGNKESFGYATGGWTAAPATARVVASMVSVLGLKPQAQGEDSDPAASLRQYVSVKGHD